MTNPPSRTQRPFSFGKLYDRLMEVFPEHRTVQGIFDIPRLAKDMGMSKEAVYRFMRSSRLNPAQTNKLVAASVADTKRRGADTPPLTVLDMIPFVFG